MTTGAMQPLVDALRAAFASAMASGEIDVTHDAEADEVEVQADDWTLYIAGWPPTAAWFALDDDPVSDAEQREALRVALSRGGLAALRDADARLDGALATTLAASGDPLSMTLASRLRE